MADFQRARLQHFVDRGSKSYPPVFVGRKALLNEILTISRTTGVEGAGIPGNTTVIQGAPGAGKSSVLSYLTRFNTHRPETGPKVLHISSVELEENFSDVLLAIGALGRTRKSRLKEIALEGARGLGGLALLDVAGLIDFNIQNVKNVFRECAIQNIGSLHKAFPVKDWKTPVIVAVDEAQNLPSGLGTSQANFLRALHEAVTKLPLTLVLAGLGDTRERIRSMGLTQGVQARSLGGFTRAETDLLTDRWCAHFGITIGGQRPRIDHLMAKADGWPRHVHWAQQALAEALLATGVEGAADRIADWCAVHARSDRLRQGYYSTQYSDGMNFSPQFTAQVLHDVGAAERTGRPLDARQLRQKIRVYRDTDQAGNFEYPPGQTAPAFITHLIHCGALEENPETGALTCPIPSFQSYILRRGGLDPAVRAAPALNREGPPSRKDGGDDGTRFGM